MIAKQLESRFLRYVAIDTQSDASVKKVPSTEGQWELARLLCDELLSLGFEDTLLDENGIVTTKIVGNHPAKAAIGFLAHLDTVDVGLNSQVKAQKIHYSGQEIVMNEALGILFDKQTNPEIENYLGDDIFISDGTSVLGADDKAAIATMMTIAENIAKGDIEHGDLYFAFLPDEEIGLRGAKLMDLERFSPDYAYTLDCCEIGEVVYETFNAGHACVHIKGVTAHPMSAKGVLVNPILIANDIINQFDPMQTPEHTEGREGYIWFTDIISNAAQAKLDIAIRDHDLAKYQDKKVQIESVIEQMSIKYPSADIKLEMSDTYSNIANSADRSHPAVDAIYHAFAQLSITPKTLAMRGGTDGSALSAMGLVTPNYFTGAHNFHSKYEYLPMSSFIASYNVTKTLIDNVLEKE
ncbi:peptidase T [Vibrio profundum]|uniref:peptidase T n=1 Tax=Vibrio profundum TaxID=2910247 RepID=UPI003D10BA98